MPTLTITISLDNLGLGVQKSDRRFHLGFPGDSFDITVDNTDPTPNGAHHLQMDRIRHEKTNQLFVPFAPPPVWLVENGTSKTTTHTVLPDAPNGRYKYVTVLDHIAVNDPEIVVDPDTVKAMRATKPRTSKGAGKGAVKKKAAAKKNAAAKKKGAPKRGGKKTAKRRATRKKR